MGWRSTIRKLDMFRKVPMDLTEGSICGTFLTIVCYISVGVLVALELNSFFTVDTRTDYIIEQHDDEFIQINFDITMKSLSCELASLDIVNQMGTHRINVTQNIRRWQVYESGYTREVSPMELNQDLSRQDVMTTETMSVVIKGMTDFQRITSSKPVVFVDFFAPWCHWCQALAPIYEGVAQRVSQGALSANVIVAKVDCTNRANFEVCTSNRIQAYPTLIAFTPTSQYKYFHYHGIRTVDAMLNFLESLVAQAGDIVTANLPLLNLTAGKEGCRLKGRLTVPRMSGNFHISCHGSHASVLPSQIDVSHIVHNLTFGDVLLPYEREVVPRHIMKGMDVLNGKYFPVYTTNTSYEHILKVFPTQINHQGITVDMFQYTSDSGMGVSDEDFPEATFSFEFNPLTIVISDVKKPLYHFVTSLFAIIGGVVTVISLIDSIFNKAEMIYQEKELLGKAE